MTHIFDDKYKLCKQIGRGSYGEIVEGVRLSDGQIVAIKLENVKINRPMLKHECMIYEDLIKNGVTRVPRIYCYGTDIDHNILIMEKLGDSIEGLFQKCGKKLSVGTSAKICYQVLESLEILHSLNYVHRDVKPENFLVKNGKVYLIDFGLTKKYRNHKSNHLPFSTGRSLLGTARYASLNSHAGYELSRRDDLESLIYILIYLIKGSLPWQKALGNTRSVRYSNIYSIKKNTSLRELCDGCPENIYHMLAHVRSLDFTEKPNYRFLRQLMLSLTDKKNYDWIKLNINP